MKRKIKTKNYIIAASLTVVVVALTFYISAWYKTIKDYNNNNSVMKEVLNVVDAESLSNYILENPTSILYISSSNDKNVKSFERSFKKLVLENDLENSLVYFDTKDYEEDELNKLFLKYSNSKLKLKKIIEPNFLYFEDGKLSGVLYVKKSSIKKNDAKVFLESLGFIEND